MARALNIMVILLVGCLLTAHSSVAQSLGDATALTQQVIELYKQDRYSEAVPLAQRALAIYKKTLGPGIVPSDVEVGEAALPALSR